MHFKWGSENICVQKCTVSYNFPSHRRQVLASAVCKGIIRVCFLAVPCLLSQSRAQPCTPHPFLIPLGPAPHPPPPPPPAPSIRPQWAITALWGVDTFTCSSICDVVINFLSVSWLELQYPETWSGVFSRNQSPNRDRTEAVLSLYHPELFTAAAIQRDRTRWPIKKTWGSFVCYRLLWCSCGPGPSINCAITPPRHMQPIKTTDSPGRWASIRRRCPAWN